VLKWCETLSAVREDWCYVLPGNSPLLHGFISSEDVAAALRGTARGTYLFRFSKSQPESLAVSVAQGDGSVLHALMRVVQPSGVAISQGDGSELHFASLQKLALGHPELRQPFMPAAVR
jgi:hypothetical protein